MNSNEQNPGPDSLSRRKFFKMGAASAVTLSVLNLARANAQGASVAEATTHGTMVAMPYPMEVNDVVTIAVQHQSPEEFLRRMRDTFDRLYAEGAEQARVMGIAIHPYLSGVPHRIKYLEQGLNHICGHKDVLFWKGEQLLDWHTGHSAGHPAIAVR